MCRSKYNYRYKQGISHSHRMRSSNKRRRIEKSDCDFVLVMELDKSILLQKQVKDNSEDLQSEFLDMKNWETLMKQKEQELLSEHNKRHIAPPIRSKNKKTHATTKSTSNENSKRIKAYDYTSWDKFDADKSCPDLEEEEQSSDASLESISKEQLEKNHNKAIEYKQEGNCFVQQKEWDKAIDSYTKAIEIFPYDAIFYANRALCYLKQDSWYLTEADCSTAIGIDNTYVKAYHRRATARIGLKHYKEAKQDIEKILILEPSNKDAKALLDQVNKQLEKPIPIVKIKKDIADDIPVQKNALEKVAEKMSSDVKSNKKIIDTEENNNKENNINRKSIVKPTTVSATERKGNWRVPDWLPEKDNVKIVELVTKPPHLRSKEPFKRIPVQEADLSKPFKEKIETSCITIKSVELSDVPVDDTTKCHENIIRSEPKLEENFAENHIEMPPIPKTAVQFVINWRKCISSDLQYRYLKQLSPGSLPKIFKDSLETGIFSDILSILKTEFVKRQEPIFWYLKDLSDVRRFRALIMFTSNSEKQDLKLMFSYCKTFEKIPEEELAEVQNKYEI